MRSLDEFYKYIEKQERALREQGQPSEEEFDAAADNAPPSDEALARALEEAEREGLRAETPVKPVDPLPPTPPPPAPRPAAPPRPAGRFRYVMRGGVTIPVPLDEEEPAPTPVTTTAPAPPTPASAPPAPVVRPSAPVESPLTEDERNALQADLPPAPAPRPRTIHRAPIHETPTAAPVVPAAPEMSEGEAAALWGRLPRHIQLLVGMTDTQEEVAQKYYRRGFKESRQQLVERLLDPTLTLEDTARILGVCPTTVRRYTNRGQLPHHRTVGQQRRFRLSDVLAFLEKQAARGGIVESEDASGE